MVSSWTALEKPRVAQWESLGSGASAALTAASLASTALIVLVGWRGLAGFAIEGGTRGRNSSWVLASFAAFAA